MKQNESQPTGAAQSAAKTRQAERRQFKADAARELTIIKKQMAKIERLLEAARSDMELLRFQRMMIRCVLRLHAES